MRLATCLASVCAMMTATGCGASRDGPRQLDRAVYQRAEKLIGVHLDGRILNGFVAHRWIGETDLFWYRREVPGGHRFVIVDASTGQTRPAFDHERLATALRHGGVEKAGATDLRLTNLTFAGEHQGSARFELEGARYHCDLQSFECDSAAVVPLPRGVLPSPDRALGVETRDGNLWLHDLDTGGAQPLTTDGTSNAGYGVYPDVRSDFVERSRTGRQPVPVDSRWSPNGRKVLVPFVDQSFVRPYPYIESVPEDGSFRPRVHRIRTPLMGERTATFEWRIFDPRRATKIKLALPYDDLLDSQMDMQAVREVWWNEDATRVYLLAFGRFMESAYLFEADTETGRVRTVVHEATLPRTDLNSTSYNPPNMRVIRNGSEVIWFSQRDGWGHLYRYDIATGREINPITTGEWLVRDVVHVDESRGIVYFTGSGREPGDPYLRYLYRVALDGSDLRLLTPEPADHLVMPVGPIIINLTGNQPALAISPSGQYVVYNYSTVTDPPKAAIRRTDDATLVALFEEADASGMYADGWRPPEPFVVKAADGTTDLYGVLYKPSDFDPSKTYPVLDAQYASPLTAVGPHNFYQSYRGRNPISQAAYAELGFIVVTLDARGTVYRSKAFVHHSYGNLHTDGFDDHVAAIRELASSRPYMDLSRVGVYGHSYGGFGAFRAMFEYPDFYKVGIASAPPGDMFTMYNDYHFTAMHGRPRYANGSEWKGDDPAEVPANYRVTDLREKVAGFEGKILIQMGELDENVPPGSTLQIVNALVAANKDFDLLYLPNRNHNFIGEGYVMRRNFDFMVRHLRGLEPPANYRIELPGR